MAATNIDSAFAVAALPLPPEYGEFYKKWLAAGYGDRLPYLQEPSRYAPDCGRPWAHYAVVLAQSLPLHFPDFPLPPPPLADSGLIGSVSLYALGNDYHLVMPKLAAAFIQQQGISGQTEITVDSAAVNERAIALASGLAKRGRHGGLIHPQLGTNFVLAVIFCETLPLPLAAMAQNIAPAAAQNPCGACHICQQACPAQALENGSLDATRCLSYWSIEHRGALAPEVRENWPEIIFGCDLCLRVCPYSKLHNSRTAGESGAVQQAKEYILSNSNKALERNLRGTAYSRARGNGLKRNSGVVGDEKKNEHD